MSKNEKIILLRNVSLAFAFTLLFWTAWAGFTGNGIPVQEVNLLTDENSENVEQRWTVPIYRGWDIPSAAVFALIFSFLYFSYKKERLNTNTLIAGLLAGFVFGFVFSSLIGVFSGLMVIFIFGTTTWIIFGMAEGILFITAYGSVMAIAFGGPVGLVVVIPVLVFLFALKGLGRGVAFIFSRPQGCSGKA